MSNLQIIIIILFFDSVEKRSHMFHHILPPTYTQPYTDITCTCRQYQVYEKDIYYTALRTYSFTYVLVWRFYAVILL